jgi:tetratricopeptide (TPR) repeat protein
MVMAGGDLHNNTHLWADTSRLELFNGRYEEAELDVNKALEMNRKVGGLVPAAGAAFGADAALLIERMRKAVSLGKASRALRQKARRAVARYLSNSRKFAPDLIEALRFAGSYRWHAGSRRRALAYWKRSIREGERLGAKVELSHTLSDAGKLLGEMTPGPEWRKRGAELYWELGISSE